MSYSDLEAILYDWECDLTLDRQRRDAPFFHDLLGRQFEPPAPVAVLGCGTGRVAIPLARAGWNVTGIDLSAARLAAAAVKNAGQPAIEWRMGDMRRPFGHRPFAAVIVPYSAFLLLQTDADRRACLKATRDALRPGGLLLLDVSPNFARRPRQKLALQLQGRCADLAAQVRYLEGVRQCAARETTIILRRYRIKPDGGDACTVRYFERWRTLWPDQLAALARHAGLEMVGGYADYSGTPLFVNGQVVADAAKHIYLLSPSRSRTRSVAEVSASA